MKRPSPAELAILQTLERLGPATVRQVHDTLSVEGSAVYTTVLKQLQVLHTKGLVTRDTSGRSHVYAAAVDASEARSGLLGEFVRKVFGGSTRDLILGALGSDDLTDEERAEIAKALRDEL